MIARRLPAWSRLAVGCVVVLAWWGSASSAVRGRGVVRIVVMGDSNSQASFDRTITRWPERLRAALGVPAASRRHRWRIRNLAWFGMTACDLGRKYGGFALGAPPHLDRLLAQARLPDLLIFAFGTNDVALGVTPIRLVECYLRLRAAAAARGVRSMIAFTPHTLVPPYPVDRNAIIDEGNRLLRANVPARFLVDFVRGMAPRDYLADGLHLGDSGQEKRMKAALRALRRVRLGERTSRSSARAAPLPA